MHSSCFSRGTHDPTPRFPPLAPVGDRSPVSSVLSRRYDFLPPVPPHFVAFVWRYLRVHSFSSLPGGRVHRQGLELVTRYLQSGIRRGTNRVLPSSWGTSVIRLPCSSPTPAELLTSDRCDAAAWPLVCKKQRLPRKVFRSSIAWLSDSLFTLRGVSYLSTTQNSLPIAGQALPDGISTRKVPLEGFKVVDYISSPFPKLAWRNCIDRTEFGRSLRSSFPDFWSVVGRSAHRTGNPLRSAAPRAFGGSFTMPKVAQPPRRMQAITNLPNSCDCVTNSFKMLKSVTWVGILGVCPT